MPGALPSIRISRGCTTTASAIAGLVTAMRVTSKSVVSTVERPAVSATRGSRRCGGACACGLQRGRQSDDDCEQRTTRNSVPHDEPIE